MTHPRRSLPLLAPLLAAVTLPACQIAYVARSAAFQAELLASREPVERALGRGDLDPERARKLALVPRIKAYGERIGLAPTRSYEAIASRWERTLVNLSACGPLTLEPHTWWFPVVGRVPYLGFFRERDARRWEARLAARDLDVWTRPVGAYSTLGWFRDPVLPGMLGWEEHRLAEVVLHEMAHATLWVPGAAGFNETYAMVVGEEASRRWISAEYGAASREVLALDRDRHDALLWRTLLDRLHADLAAIYAANDRPPEERLALKAARFAALAGDVEGAGFADPGRYLRAVREQRWNNARVAQARTYDENRALLETLLARRGGDIRAFTADLRTLATEEGNLWDVVRASTGAAPAAPER